MMACHSHMNGTLPLSPCLSWHSPRSPSQLPSLASQLFFSLSDALAFQHNPRIKREKTYQITLAFYFSILFSLSDGSNG